MATPQRIPVQDLFKIKTPSMTVTITTEDLLIPPLSGQIPVPGNLVTIDPNPQTSIRTPAAAEEASPKIVSERTSPSFAAASTEVPTHRPANGQTAQDLSERRESDGSIAESVSSSPLLRRESSASIVFAPRRSTSKHADALYGKLGAPPPIQPLDAEVLEERTREGFEITHDKALESRDYTYWDKLRRSGTRTEIRRWHTYVPEGEDETAFFGRSIGIKVYNCCGVFHQQLVTAGVDVPIDAYRQGIYFKQEEEDIGVKEYKLPTRSYVAPAVWIRRTKGIDLRGFSQQCTIPITAIMEDAVCRCSCDIQRASASGTSSVAVEN